MNQDNPKTSKRDKILEAAVLVFSQKGYHDTKMEDVAQMAGIGKGTIYEYFDSKLHLFQDIMSTSVSIYYDRLGAANRDSMSFRDRLKHIFEAHIRFCQEKKELSRIIFWDTEYMDKELREWGYEKRKEKEKKLIEMIEQAIERGEIKRMKSELVAMTIVGANGTVFLPIVLGEMDIDAARAAEEFTSIILDGVANREIGGK